MLYFVILNHFGKEIASKFHFNFAVGSNYFFEIAKLKANNVTLTESYNDAKSAAFLESRTAKFTDKKAAYLKKVLSDKSPRFIEENFEYTARLFDRKEQEQLEVIREEAISQRTVKADAPKPVVVEKVEPSTPSNPYLSGLDKMK